MYNGFSYELLACNSFYENCLYNRFFIQIVSMWWFLCILLVCDVFLYIFLLLNMKSEIIFSMKRGYVYVWGTCKNVWVLWVCFLKSKSIQAKKCLKTVYLQLLNVCMYVCKIYLKSVKKVIITKSSIYNTNLNPPRQFSLVTS